MSLDLFLISFMRRSPCQFLIAMVAVETYDFSASIG